MCCAAISRPATTTASLRADPQRTVTTTHCWQPRLQCDHTDIRFEVGTTTDDDMQSVARATDARTVLTIAASELSWGALSET